MTSVTACSMIDDMTCWDWYWCQYSILVLSEVINRKNDHGIMQPACINLCARMAAIEFVSIGWCIGIGWKWGESHFDHGAGKGESHPGWSCRRVIFTFAFSRIIPALWIHRSIVISLYSDIVMECLMPYQSHTDCHTLAISYAILRMASIAV